MKAYRILNWKGIGEVTDKGKAAQANTPDEKIKKTKPKYIRWRTQGHSLEPAYRRLTKKAYGLGVMMEMACIGLYVKLLDLAGDWDDPDLRGWILDDLKRPMNPYQIAELLEIKDTNHVKAVFDLLCDPDIKLLEVAEFSGFPPHHGESGGIEGNLAESGGVLGKKGEEVENLFLNETETEERSLNLNNETERQIPTFPQAGGNQGEQTAAPASALVSDTDSVSDLSATASVSDSAPRQGLRSVEDIKKESAKIVIQICELKGLRPKTQSDYTTYSDIFEQLRYRVIYETDEPLFEMALKKAKESCRFGDNPRKMFVAAMKKKPFSYVPKSHCVVRGATDKYHHQNRKEKS